MTAAYSLVGFGPESATDSEIGDLPSSPSRANCNGLLLYYAPDPLSSGALALSVAFPGLGIGILSRAGRGPLWSHA